MRVSRMFFTSSIRNYQRKSSTKIYRKTDNGWKVLNNANKEDISKSTTIHNQTQQNEEVPAKNDEIITEQLGCRINEMKIQMLSKTIYDQIFKNNKKKSPDKETINRYQETLQKHGIKLGETPLLPDVDIKLPPLKGANIVEHFYEIAQEQSMPYKQLIETLSNAEVAPMPKTWKMVEGWTRYDRDGNAQSVPYPDDTALIFD